MTRKKRCTLEEKCKIVKESYEFEGKTQDFVKKSGVSYPTLHNWRKDPAVIRVVGEKPGKKSKASSNGAPKKSPKKSKKVSKKKAEKKTSGKRGRQPKFSLEVKAKHVKATNEMSGAERKEYAKKNSLSPSSLQSWHGDKEVVKFSGVTKKRGRKKASSVSKSNNGVLKVKATKSSSSKETGSIRDVVAECIKSLQRLDKQLSKMS